MTPSTMPSLKPDSLIEIGNNIVETQACVPDQDFGLRKKSFDEISSSSARSQKGRKRIRNQRRK